MMNQNLNQDLTNNSGQGKGSRVLSVVSDKFNWGAFFFSWIWGLCNKCYLTLIIIPVAFVPVIGGIASLAMAIWFGVEGNKWAWQNKRWNSIDHFHSVQKKWAIASLIYVGVLFVLCIVGIALSIMLPFLMTDTQEQRFEVMKKKNIAGLINASEMNMAMDEKCDFTSEGLASYYIKRVGASSQDENKLYLMDGSVWEFTGDGYCISEGDCSVLIDGNGEKSPNLDGQDIFNVPLYLKEDKYPYPAESVVNESFGTY